MVEILLMGNNQTNFQDFPFTPAYLACRNLEDLSTAQVFHIFENLRLDQGSLLSMIKCIFFWTKPSNCLFFLLLLLLQNHILFLCWALLLLPSCYFLLDKKLWYFYKENRQAIIY